MGDVLELPHIPWLRLSRYLTGVYSTHEPINYCTFLDR